MPSTGDESVVTHDCYYNPSHARRPGHETFSSSRTRWIFFALGICVLLPWNVMINEMTYFVSKLEHSAYQDAFPSYLSASMSLANFAFMIHATFYATSTPSRIRINRSILIVIAMLVVLTISPLFPFSGGLFFSIIILNGVIQSAAGSYFQTAVVGIAALFGSSALQSHFSGQAASGVVVSAIQFVSVLVSAKNESKDIASLALPPSQSFSASLFFGVTTLCMAMALVAHSALQQTPSYHAVVLTFEQSKGTIVEVVGREEVPEENQPFISQDVQVHISSTVKVSDMAWTNAVYNVAVAYVFIVTLSVFPPITSSIYSVNQGTGWVLTQPALFVSLHFLIFNVGDWLGRHLCTYPQLLVWSPQKLAILSFCRTIFIPIFLVCNVNGVSSPASLGTVIINSDILFLIIVLMFGTSNGYLASMIMAAASSIKHNPILKKEQIEGAATVAQFFLIGGILVGSIFSFLVKHLICRCNPFYA
ncbi:nucleoside transporter-domain-containing protein [Cantharellus anzutake]|uniref:nucleoside transporter-domain-containing protein n=1 Tax=Cantharellus anzutake TaxID=1750568 RepID=UPI001902FF0F|nr:nucleoside transporter-domain-containing protein [Cantharellus anzutake]KAF8334989.1 nucleoside transporter-domain-containing protein [Cantharellus anzutake]